MFLPAECHGQTSLAGYSPWGCRQLDTTEQLMLFLLLGAHRRPPAGWLSIGVQDRIKGQREQATWTQKQDVSGHRRRLLLQPDELHRLRFLSQKRRKTAEKAHAGGGRGSSGPWGLPPFLVRWRVCLSMHFMFLNNRNTIKKKRKTLSH